MSKIDEDTLEILSEEAILTFLTYNDQLKHLFTLFLHPNFNAGKKVLTWKVVEEKRFSMIARCFLKLCRINFLIPHCFNVESLQAQMKATIPPLTTEENTFFESSEVIKAYESDKNY